MKMSNLFAIGFKTGVRLTFIVPALAVRNGNPPEIYKEIVHYTRKIKSPYQFTYYYSEEKRKAFLTMFFENRYDAWAVKIKYGGELRQ